MAVFTSKEFIDRLIKLVNEIPNYYYSQNGTWCTYNPSNGKFMMDCVVSVKGILWGFTGDKTKPRGGAVYCSNGVPDFTCDGALNYCSDVSQNFANLIAGEYLCMKGTGYNHTGIYLGNNKVFECTTGWGANRCIISDIDQYGNRSLNGVSNLRWTYHGKLNFIDYKKEQKFKIGDKVIITGNLYVNANEDKTNGSINNYLTEIASYDENAKHPYNTTKEIGFMDEKDIALYIEPTDLKVGDIVKIIATGNGSSYGNSNVAYGIGWTERILKIYDGRPYPYQVGDDNSTIGFYQKSALEKVK